VARFKLSQPDMAQALKNKLSTVKRVAGDGRDGLPAAVSAQFEAWAGGGLGQVRPG